MTNEFASTAPYGDVESTFIISHKNDNVNRNKGYERMKKNGELSLEQLRQKLHISKRKAAWMLQNGVIPCRIVNTPTHLRYYASEEDLRAYMKQSITESKKEFVRGQFSSRDKDAPYRSIKFLAICHAAKVRMARESDKVVYRGDA